MKRLILTLILLLAFALPGYAGSYHKDLTGDELHVQYKWTFTNSTTRGTCTAATGGTCLTEDIGSIAWQTDDDSFWFLLTAAPTWGSLGTGSGDSVQVEGVDVGSSLANFEGSDPPTSGDIKFVLSGSVITGVVVSVTGKEEADPQMSFNESDIDVTGGEGEMQDGYIDFDCIGSDLCSYYFYTEAGNDVESLVGQVVADGSGTWNWRFGSPGSNYANIDEAGVLSFGGTGTILIVSGNDASLPATCTVGDLYLSTDGDTDGELYICKATDSWKAVDDDGAAGGGDVTDVYGCLTGDCFDLTMADGDSLDASAVVLNATGEGIIITVAADCDALTGISTGVLCYDSTDDALCAYDGTAMDCQALGVSGSGDITDVFGCDTGDCSSITAADGDLLNLSGITSNSATEGFILPLNDSSCAGSTAEGQLCWDGNSNDLYGGTGAAVTRLNDWDLLRDTEILDGIAGGRTVIGGTAAGDDLTLQTTEDVTKGSYILTELDCSAGDSYITSNASGVLACGTDDDTVFVPAAAVVDDHSGYVAGHTDGANCVTATHFAVGVDAAGVAECEAIGDADVPATVARVAGDTFTGNLSLSDGAGDSPSLILVPATGTSWSFFAEDTGDDARVEVNTANPEAFDFENLGGGVVNVNIDGTLAAATVTGANVTTGADPGHTHGPTSISGLDVADITTGEFTDAFVSDTLTASVFKGSGTTTDAIDLATAEVAGVLPDANVDTAIARLAAPTFTGDAKGVKATVQDDDTSLATTSFVNAEIAADAHLRATDVVLAQVYIPDPVDADEVVFVMEAYAGVVRGVYCRVYGTGTPSVVIKVCDGTANVGTDTCTGNLLGLAADTITCDTASGGEESDVALNATYDDFTARDAFHLLISGAPTGTTITGLTVYFVGDEN